MPLACVRGLGLLIGYGLWVTNSRGARVSLLNIQMCFPELDEQAQTHLAKKSMIESAVTGLEMFKVWSIKPEAVFNQVVEVKGEGLYREYLEHEKGLFMVAPHLGNWEVMGLYCALSEKLTSLYAPIRYEALDTLVKASREATGAHLVPTNQQGVKALFKALRRHEQVGILPDQQAEDGSGLFSPFFGHDAYTMTLLNSLRLKSASRVLMCFAERVPNGWCIHFVEPDEMIYAEDLQQAVNGLNKSVERCVRACPEQYQWEYKRFRKQADNSNPYDVIK